MIVVPSEDRAKEILFNLERHEFDEDGRPKIAYRSTRQRDKSQLLLFREDQELERYKELLSELEDADLSRLTPLDALNFLNDLKKKASSGKSG